MACDQKTLELISCYADGEATSSEVAQAEAHLETCAECRGMVDEWHRGLEMFDWAYTSAIPEDIPEPVYEGYGDACQIANRKSRRLHLPSVRTWALAAAVLVLAIISMSAYQHLGTTPLAGSISTHSKSQVVSMEGVRLVVEPESRIVKLASDAVKLERGRVTASVDRRAVGFKVRTDRVVVTDLGTRFTVEVQAKSDIVQVHKGSVSAQSGGQSHILKKGDSMVVSDIAQPVVYSQPGSDRIVSLTGILMLMVVILVVGFWIWMLIDAMQHDFPNGGSKIAWILAILFGGTLGALIYLAVVKDKGTRCNRPIRLILVGRRGDQRVIVWGNVAILAVVGGIIAVLATIAYYTITRTWSALVWLVVVSIFQVIVGIGIRRAMTIPIEQLTDMEHPESAPGAQHAENKGLRMVCWVLLAAGSGILALVLISVIRSFIVGSTLSFVPIILFVIIVGLIVTLSAYYLFKRKG